MLPPELCCDRCVNSELARLCLNELGWGETRFTAEEFALRRAAAARAIRSGKASFQQTHFVTKSIKTGLRVIEDHCLEKVKGTWDRDG